MNIRALFSLFLILFSIPLLHSVSAAGTIPRDGLRLELLLATGAQDTSGNSRPVTATGIAPTYQVDPVYGIPYAQFSGSGGLRVNTAWSAGASDDFTVSMWIKIDSTAFSSYHSGGYVLHQWVSQTPWSGTDRTFFNYPMQVISFKTNDADNSGLQLNITNEQKCTFSPVETTIGSYWAGYGPLGYGYYGEKTSTFTNMSNNFNCSNLFDNKWHNIVIRKNSGKTEFFVDTQSIISLSLPLTIARNGGIGNSPFTLNGNLIGNPSQDVQNKVFNNHFFRGGINTIRMYSRSLSNDEIESLYTEYSVAQATLVGAGNVQISVNKYTKPMLSFFLKNIPLNLSKENVTYQYSTDGKSFSDFSASDILVSPSSTGSLSYQMQFDASNIPDGNITLTIRVKDTASFQNIGTITFTKNDTVYSILINQPDSTESPSKIISASTNSGGILYLSLTRSSICDATLAFEEYSDLLFTSKSDNAIRVCYKSYFPLQNKTIYKISAPIQGITPTNQFSSTYRLFDDYTLWTKSLYPKPSDSTLLILDLLGVSSGQSQGTINGITMTDINGDGLVDFLYSRNDPVRRAILINNGNYTFKTVYKCAIDSVNGTTIYYGDCADPTR